MESNVVPITEDKAAQMLAIAHKLADVLHRLATEQPRRPIQPETTGPAPATAMVPGPKIVRFAS